MHLSRGPTPAAEYILEMTADLVVHSYDLAAATDGDTELDGELVTAALRLRRAAARGRHPRDVRPPLDVPPSAPPLVRLLARFGRRP